jgi:hypothetical protein
VLDMEKGDQNALILIKRPFLKTFKTKINVHSGTLTWNLMVKLLSFIFMIS